MMTLLCKHVAKFVALFAAEVIAQAVFVHISTGKCYGDAQLI